MNLVARACSFILAGVTLVAAGSLVGCAGSYDGGNGGTNEGNAAAGNNEGNAVDSTRSSTLTEVGTLSAFGADVTFYAADHDGRTEIGMREASSAFAKRSVVGTLLNQGLTTQELYLALAPAGAAAPPALVAAQADEAAQMGRSAEVRQVAVDASQFVEKTVAACESHVFGAINPPDPPPFQWALAAGKNVGISGLQWVNWPAACGIGTTTWAILGACEDSGNGRIGVNAWENWGPNCFPQTIGSFNVPPFGQANWFWRDTRGANYFVSGQASGGSINYDLILGIEEQ
jgi:hypothetical protein